MRHAAQQIVNIFRQSNFIRQLDLQPNKCSRFDNCKHDVHLNVAHLSNAKKASQNQERGNYYFLSNSIPYSLEIKLERTTSTKRKIGELQSFLQDPKFWSLLESILVETSA